MSYGQCSGGSRISHRGGADPLAGAWTSDVGAFQQKCMQKQKNLVPWGGGGRAPDTPPRSANAMDPNVTEKQIINYVDCEVL